ncbi:MAG: SLBB domain-containing protein [Bryobacteraceae bacterium]
MRLPVVRVLAPLPLLIHAVLAQQGQTGAAADCNSQASSGDPRCLAGPRSAAPTRADEMDLPRIPVIRDPNSPQYQSGQSRRGETTGQNAADSRSPYAAEEPTAFQEFVEQSVGKLLPVFGAELFREVPSTFSPADPVPVTPDYVVGPGDQLLIRAWGQIDLNVSPVVDRAGAIYIPQIGSEPVAGLQFLQVQDFLKTAIGRVYRNFDLSVNMGQLRSIQVFVLGQARRPGAYTVSSLSTLVNAIFASGGPNGHGSMRRIRLMRQDQAVCEFDLYDLLQRGDKSKDQRLLSGDVIYIPPVGPQVAMAGSVNMPGIYELKGGGTLEEGLQLAGGLTPVAAKRKAIIERIEDSTRRVVEASLAGTDAAAAKLQDGDVVSVLSVAPRFENAVTLRGNVADPIRMPWRPGMKIRDLIPDREALLTRDYWQARNRLAFPARPGEPSENEPRDSIASTELVAYPPPGGDLESGLDGVRRNGASLSPTDPNGAGAGSARVGPGSIGASRDQAQSARNHVERNALETNWSYAVIERRDPQTLTTTLIPFRLGKVVIDGDETENLPLEPGDVITIFSTADVKLPQNLQSRYVRLEGEFESAGVYSVRPGETLRQLVQRAGGLTPQAYLFGSQFTRASAKLEQQQRLDDLVNSLERQVASSAANVRGSVISPEEAAAANSEITGERELVGKLRQVRATGRIVLDLDSRDSRPEKLPDLPLEDGDVFTVPSEPSFINVIGSVYNGTSFVFSDSKRVGDYLREAGGSTRTGDSRHTFLIRADGSVASKSRSIGLVGQKFEDLHLNPGDTIVVPEQINKTTFLKGLKDWAQVFAQFGLGAAAINILR